MALIKCPDCGKEFSSMAKACPQCGCPVEYAIQNDVKCPECGSEIEPSAKICSNCGCPMEAVRGKDDKHSEYIERSMSSSLSSENSSPAELDYDKIFIVKKDENNEGELVSSNFIMEDKNRMVFPSVDKPFTPYLISIKCLMNHDKKQYFLCYHTDVEALLPMLLESAGKTADDFGLHGLGKDIEEAIVTIDGIEKIKVAGAVQKDKSTWFLIDKEQVVQCCNAHYSIKFKLFRKDGSSFTIEGNEEDTRLMIDSIRGIYHYIDDRTLYSDSIVRLQKFIKQQESTTEVQPKDKGNFISNPSSENISPSNVDYNKIFNINEDELEEIRMVETEFAMENATKIDFPYPLDPSNPYLISIECLVNNTGNNYLLHYAWGVEQSQLELLEVAGVSNDKYSFGVAFKGAIITIDGTETIKLADVVGDNCFLMDKEQVIKCCNAHSIKFKLFRKNGNSFTIEGTEENTRLMIDAFRGLYHYIEDRTMYIDSLIRLQRWYEKLEEAEKEEKQQQETKKAAEETNKRPKKTIGLILIIIGLIIFLVPLFILMANPYYHGRLSAVWTILGFILMIVGAVFLGLGQGKKVSETLTTIGNNLK